MRYCTGKQLRPLPATQAYVSSWRARWPRAEALLAREAEIIITRDGKPVAKLVRLREAPSRRKRFDPRKHARWQDEVNRGRLVRLVDEFLTPDRDAR